MNRDRRYEENGGVPTAPVPPPRYDPARLLADVAALLRHRGLTPIVRVTDLPVAHAAAAVLLRCLGVEVVRFTSLSDPTNVDMRVHAETPEVDR